LLLALSLGILTATAAIQAQDGAKPKPAGKIKTVSGKLREVKDNQLTLQKAGLLSESEMHLEMDAATEKSGDIIPGVHAKIRYREVEGRKIVVRIETRPEYASKLARDAMKQDKDSKPPKDKP
jgi:hypothetical protein